MKAGRLQINLPDAMEAVDSFRPDQLDDYRGMHLSFFAKRSDEALILVLAEITLLAEPEKRREELFQFDNFVAGKVFSPFTKAWKKRIWKAITHGVLEVPQMRMSLPGEGSDNKLSLYVDDIHPSREEPYFRQKAIVITGRQIHDIVSGGLNAKSIDRELKVGRTPFVGLTDLFRHLNLTGLNVNSNGCSIRVIKGPRAFIQTEEVEFDPLLKIPVIASKSIDKSGLALSIVARLDGSPEFHRFRHDFSAAEFFVDKGVIKAAPEFFMGEKATFAYAVLSYFGDFLQQQYYENPTFQSNLDVAMFRKFDPELSNLSKSLLPTTDKDASSFEDGVHCLFHLLGFRSLLLGQNPKFKNFVDLVVTPGGGRYLLIECTTGMPENEQKIGKLRSRARLVREHFESLGFAVPEIVPVLATTLARSDVSEFKALIRKSGIVLLDREDFSVYLASLGGSANPIDVYTVIAANASD